MFCKVAYCVLVAMIALTHCGGNKRRSIQYAQCGYVKLKMDCFG